MTTRRIWMPLALTCLFAVCTTSFVQSDTLVAQSDTEIVQIGRRRTARAAQPRQQAEKPEPAKHNHPLAGPAQRPAENSETEADQQQAAPTSVDPLLMLAERAISKTSMRYLDADQHTPWQIMHGVLALRKDFVLTRGESKINCIEFISDAPRFRGESWWQATKHGGRAHPFSVPYAFEGHVNQFLALLSMSDLPLDHKFNIDGTQTVTMADMVEHAKMNVSTREEITWTLWFLLGYVDIDAEWVNEAGDPWSIEELVRIQTRAQVVNAPCGGCHGLYAIAYARNAYLQKHGKLRGVYFQAEQKINQHIELARRMQNNDGSLSTEFFKGPGESRDFNERIKASGHMLEWLMMALPQERLNEPWVRKAIASISTDLIHNASKPAECGPLYHALNSLIMYRDRVKPQLTPTEDHPLLAEVPAEESAPEMTVAPGPSELEAADNHGIELPLPASEQDERTMVSSDVARLPEPTPADGLVPDYQTIPGTAEPSPTLRPIVTRSDRLTQRAAERLANVIRQAQEDLAPIASEPERPPLLRSPYGRPARTAAEPPVRVTR